jgi:hypothetical protein
MIKRTVFFFCAADSKVELLAEFQKMQVELDSRVRFQLLEFCYDFMLSTKFG